MTPIVLTLDDPAAVRETVGGKGASLARLARAGLPVPPGFHVTTDAYRDFVARDHLRDLVLEAVGEVDTSDPATAEEASRAIGDLFARQDLPKATADAIAQAHAALGEDVPVAVRSSATAEDLPGLSFAGQQDTFLNVTGRDDVVSAVRRCWASLWTARAIAYRARNGIPSEDVSLAVVVQRMVPADAAGVLFTADPVTGARDRLVVNAAWGLGEAVVGGQVTPDTVVLDRANGAVLDRRIGDKTVMTVGLGAGTEEREVPPELRHAPVLSTAEAATLGRIGTRIEELTRAPMDIEWARADGELFVVQARPITNLAAVPATSETWNDSVDGDYLWSSGNLGEAIPDVMTPATWSFVRMFMSRAMASSSIPGYRGYGRIGGRFYMNLSMAASLARAVGIPMRRFVAFTEPTFGRLPPGETIPLVPVPRWTIVKLMAPVLVAVVRRARADRRELPGFVAAAADRCDALRARIGRTSGAAGLVDVWHGCVEPYFLRSCDMLAAGTRVGGAALVTVPARLRSLVGEADAAALVSGQQAGRAQLASLGPMVGLAQLARGEIDRTTFARRYGHRGAHEFEVSTPRPAEDVHWVEEQLAATRAARTGVDDLLADQERARAAAWARLAARHPRKVRTVRRMVARWGAVARTREETRSEVIRSFWVLRAWVLQAGELTGRGDDLFFLDVAEILRVLRGDDAPLAAVPARRAVYDRYRTLPPYPTLIRGPFDPARWAADPNRRTDHYDARGTSGPPTAVITGFAGASGVVEGTARLIERPEDGHRLRDGEILVTTVTNIGWTPLFPRVAAVVTDVGAPLSHAAIVARELGIPAVVGCGNATMRLRTGDHIRVDGERGTVDVLRPAGRTV